MLAATVYLTVPLPAPEAPDPIVIHATFDVAVHAQSDDEDVRVIVYVPASAATEFVSGAIRNEHGVGVGAGGAGFGDGGFGAGGCGFGAGVGATAACWIVIVCPPITTLPERSAAAFGATFSETVADRFPDPFDATVIQAAWLAADHEQPASVSTVTSTGPPFADTAVFAGVTL